MALAFALVASVALIVWRLEAVARVWMERTLAHRDATLALDTSVKAAPRAKPPLPDDLASIADRESEPWARDSVRAAIQDDYEALQDWDAVRTAYFGSGA